MPKILFVDDESHWRLAYVEEIRLRGIEAIPAHGPDECIRYLSDDPEIELVITDVMMPPGETFSQVDTNEGTITGLLLSKVIRESFPDLPIVLLSNHHWGSLRMVSEETACDLGDAIFVGKADSLPDEFARRVSDILEKGLSRAERTSLLTELGQSLVVSPAAFGVGIDLKQLFETIVNRFRQR